MIPARFTVGHSAYNGSGTDAFGNPAESWGSPTSKVYITFGSPRTSEPKIAGSDRDVVEFELIVRTDFGPVSSRDRMHIDGQVYEVIGKVEDYSKNPFRDDFGCLVINLKQVNG